MSVMLEVKAGCVCVTWRHVRFLAPLVSERRGRRYLRSSLHLISVRPAFERICWDVKNKAAGTTSHTKPDVRRHTQSFPLYFNHVCLIVWGLRAASDPCFPPSLGEWSVRSRGIVGKGVSESQMNSGISDVILHKLIHFQWTRVTTLNVSSHVS